MQATLSSRTPGAFALSTLAWRLRYRALTLAAFALLSGGHCALAQATARFKARWPIPPVHRYSGRWSQWKAGMAIRV